MKLGALFSVLLCTRLFAQDAVKLILPTDSAEAWKFNNS